MNHNQINLFSRRFPRIFTTKYLINPHKFRKSFEHMAVDVNSTTKNRSTIPESKSENPYFF